MRDTLIASVEASKSHEHSDDLDPTYTLGSEPEQKELFEAKQTFMFSVFNANLLTDMGDTIVRKHFTTTGAQAVCQDLSDHMIKQVLSKAQILLVLLSHKLLSTKYITHQFTYFIHYSSQDKFKNSRITRIQQVHQKL